MDAAPQINTGTSLDSVIGSLNGRPMDTPTYQKGLATIEKKSEETTKERDAIKPNAPPELGEVPKMQDYKTDPMQTFGSFGMVLASLGSLMTRHPMTSALNAGAEVMKAQNKGDLAAYNDAMEKWKVHADNAWKMADWEHTQTKDLYEKLKDKQGDLKAEMGVLAASTENPTLDAAVKSQTLKEHILNNEKAVMGLDKTRKEMLEYDTIQRGNIDDYLQTHKKPDGSLMDVKEIPLKDQGEIIKQTRSDWTLSKKGAADSGAYDKKYESWKEKTSSVKDADAYAGGAPIANIIRSRGKDSGENLQMIKDLAAERHPDYDRNQAVEDYNAANKAISAFGTGKQGDIVRSFDVAYSHINLLSGLAKALDNGDVKKINELSQYYSEQFGSPAPTNFDSAKRILSDEINKAVVGSAGALTDREGIAANVNRANSFDQIEGSLDTFKGLILGQVSGIEQQYKHATKRTDFEKALDPEVANDLQKYKSKKGGVTGNIPEIKTQADYDALLPDTVYMEDGNQYRKPK